MTDRDEQRRYIRVPVQLVTHLRVVGENGFDPPKEATARNISKGGVFIKTDESFAVGSLVEFALQVPDHDQQIPVGGVVRWCREDTPKGIGVEIVNAAASNEERLNKILIDTVKEIIGEP